MALSRKHQLFLSFAVMAIFFFSLSLLPPKTGGIDEELKNMILGSRPPACVNKCMNCRPCEATLVIPPHQNTRHISSRREDDSYYLVSWKCRCGNKFYHP